MALTRGGSAPVYVYLASPVQAPEWPSILLCTPRYSTQHPCGLVPCGQAAELLQLTTSMDGLYSEIKL